MCGFSANIAERGSHAWSCFALSSTITKQSLWVCNQVQWQMGHRPMGGALLNFDVEVWLSSYFGSLQEAPPGYGVKGKPGKPSWFEESEAVCFVKMAKVCFNLGVFWVVILKCPWFYGFSLVDWIFLSNPGIELAGCELCTRSGRWSKACLPRGRTLLGLILACKT